MSSDSLANLTLRHKVSGSETPFAQSARGLYSSSKSLAAAFVGLSNSLSNSTHGNTAVATNSSISGRTAGINLQSSSSSVARLKTQPNLLPLLSQNNYNSAGLEQGNRLGISPSKSLQVSTSMTLSSSYDYNIKRSLVKSRAGSSTQTQWSTRLRQSLQSTLLTPQEFFGKISRFKHANNIKRNGTTFELLEGDESDRSYEVSLRNTGVFSTTFGSIGQQSEYQYSSRSNLHDLTNHTSLIGLYNLAGMNISNTSFESEGFTLVSYKLKHCLIGVQFLFRLASVESKDIILPITNAHDWMSSFGESFLVLLPVSSAQFKSTDTSFDKLLPFLIELWFQLTIGVEITTNHDWMFWELTKVIIISDIFTLLLMMWYKY